VDLAPLFLAISAWMVIGSIVGIVFHRIIEGDWPNPEETTVMYMVAFTAIFWPIFLGFGIIMLIAKAIATLFYK
jgi:hypothetical protein